MLSTTALSTTVLSGVLLSTPVISTVVIVTIVLNTVVLTLALIVHQYFMLRDSSRTDRMYMCFKFTYTSETNATIYCLIISCTEAV